MALTDKLTAIGNAIREKNGSTGLIPLADMPQAILDIESGIEAIDHTVKFMVEGEPYEVVSVKDGNSVNAPSVEPTSEEGEFGKWSLNGSDVTFPFTPTEDVEFIAIINDLIGGEDSETGASGIFVIPETTLTLADMGGQGAMVEVPLGEPLDIVNDGVHRLTIGDNQFEMTITLTDGKYEWSDESEMYMFMVSDTAYGVAIMGSDKAGDYKVSLELLANKTYPMTILNKECTFTYDENDRLREDTSSNTDIIREFCVYDVTIGDKIYENVVPRVFADTMVYIGSINIMGNQAAGVSDEGGYDFLVNNYDKGFTMMIPKEDASTVTANVTIVAKYKG